MGRMEDIEYYMLQINRLDESSPCYETDKQRIEDMMESINIEHQRTCNRLRQVEAERQNDEMERREDYFEKLHYGY